MAHTKSAEKEKYLMLIDADPLLSFMRALWPQVIAGAVVRAAAAAAAAAAPAAAAPCRRSPVPRVLLLLPLGGRMLHAAVVAAVWRWCLLGCPPSRLISLLFTVLLLWTLGT